MARGGKVTKTLANSESGFTILEVLVAATVFLVGLSLMISLLNTTLARLGSEDLVVAGAIAETSLQSALGVADAPSVDSVVVASGKKYQLRRSVTRENGLVSVMVSVQRYKQTRAITTLYGETIDQSR
jgi:type II secretory pathway pseudopilin PulG